MDIGSLVHAFLTNAGPGGVFAMSLLLLAALIYFGLTRWIIRGGEE